MIKMELNHKGSSSKKEENKDEEEVEAMIQMWKYIFGFSEMAAIKCAIDLKIPDTIEAHGSPMTLTQLSTTLNCSSQLLHRILRFLVHRNIFKQQTITENNSTTTAVTYEQTPLSRLLTATNSNNMAPFLLLESSPVMLEPWQKLSVHLKNKDCFPFEVAHGKDVWSYAEENSNHSDLINEAMACSAEMITSAIIEKCGDIFDGVETLVDVGGGNGTILGIFVKKFDWIKGINFDLPHVVSSLTDSSNLVHFAGNMFDFVPNADVVFLKWVLHDWNDEECINILKNCKKAIPKEKGKVIIIEAVIDDEKEKINNKWADIGLMLDLVMMAHTSKGKERTYEEWAYVIKSAGFTTFTVTHIQAIQSVIQCFP